MPDLTVTVGERELAATWSDTNPRTREAIDDALPLSGEGTRWGDELYVSTPVDVPPEETQTAVPVGAISYWPQGNALCLFWGETPASHDGEPRAAAPVTVVATLDDVSPLDGLTGGASVAVERA